MASKMTDEQIARAKAVPLIDYLEKRGYELKRDGAHYVRLAEHDSLVISLEHNLWKWNTGNMGGDTIDFLMKYEGKSFPDAVIELTEEYPADRIKPIARKAERERGEFVLPTRNDTHNRVYAYLTKTRGIAPSIVRELLGDDTLYESAKYHNAVFVRYVDGVPRYCFKRGTSTYKAYRGEEENSDKRFAWQMLGTEQDTVYVFESPIDALSYATLVMRKDGNLRRRELTYLALGGTSLSALVQYKKDHTALSRIIVCVDNDKGGDKIFAALERSFGAEHQIIRHLPPVGKDWNDTLLAYQNKEFQLGGFRYEFA